MILFKKKVYIPIAALVIFGIIMYFYTDINSRFPAHEVKEYTSGEVSKYRNMDMVVNNATMYTYEEFIKEYAEYKSVFELSMLKEFMIQNYIFVVDLDIKNDSDIDVIEEKTSINLSVSSFGNEYNGSDIDLFRILNPNFNNVYKKNETTHLKLVSTFLKERIDKDEVGKKDFKFIFSYYPTKEYYLFKGGEY